ncbi:hypothetical protein FB45DRAFT_876631 [Roridomyces roridus]|uniref:Uncharacterized protein n=1 Tax=Roridomyces roridus TaxID=1738132 RepID=A0AAD7B3E6_9AGAR|nr:hypothetical protein FB45DRAFT_876631 [Roridomyces roridus]
MVDLNSNKSLVQEWISRPVSTCEGRERRTEDEMGGGDSKATARKAMTWGMAQAHIVESDSDGRMNLEQWSLVILMKNSGPSHTHRVSPRSSRLDKPHKNRAYKRTGASGDRMAGDVGYLDGSCHQATFYAASESGEESWRKGRSGVWLIMMLESRLQGTKDGAFLVKSRARIDRVKCQAARSVHSGPDIICSRRIPLSTQYQRLDEPGSVNTFRRLGSPTVRMLKVQRRLSLGRRERCRRRGVGYMGGSGAAEAVAFADDGWWMADFEYERTVHVDIPNFDNSGEISSFVNYPFHLPEDLRLVTLVSKLIALIQEGVGMYYFVESLLKTAGQDFQPQIADPRPRLKHSVAEGTGIVSGMRWSIEDFDLGLCSIGLVNLGVTWARGKVPDWPTCPRFTTAIPVLQRFKDHERDQEDLLSCRQLLAIVLQV